LTFINFSLPHSHQRISHHKFLFITVHLIFTEYSKFILYVKLILAIDQKVREGRLLLGTWQAILYIELDGGKQRNIIIYMLSC